MRGRGRFNPLTSVMISGFISLSSILLPLPSSLLEGERAHDREARAHTHTRACVRASEGARERVQSFLAT